MLTDVSSSLWSNIYSTGSLKFTGQHIHWIKVDLVLFSANMRPYHEHCVRPILGWNWVNDHQIHVELSVYRNLHSSVLTHSVIYSCSFLFVLPILHSNSNFSSIFYSEIFLSTAMFFKFLFFTITVKFLSLYQIECYTNAKANTQSNF